MTKIWKFIIQIWLGSLLTTAILGQEATSKPTKFLNKSNEMLKYMQLDTEPCKDFYDYTCGNFKNKSKTLGIIVPEISKKKLYGFLENNETDTSNVALNNVRTFYQSCKNNGKQLGEKKKQFFLDIFEEFGGMPLLKGAKWEEDKFDWLQVVGKILQKYGQQILVGVMVEPDFSNTTNNHLYIGEIGDIESEKKSVIYQFFLTTWQTDLSQTFGVTDYSSLKAAEEIIEFLMQIAKGVTDRDQDQGLHTNSNLTTLTEMDKKYGPSFNFTRLISAWLGGEQDIKADMPVYEYKAKYLENLKTVFEKTPKYIVANYIFYKLKMQIDSAGNNGQPFYYRQCLRLTKNVYFFNSFIEHQMYEQLKLAQPKRIEYAQEMFENIRQTFARVLQSNVTTAWMSENTRNKALEKLQAIKFLINGQQTMKSINHIESLTLSPDNYYENTLNMFKLQGQEYRAKLKQPTGIENYNQPIEWPVYLTDYNAVVIPMSIMEYSDLWEESYPKALHYATIGFAFARELMHAFDDRSYNYDGQGNYHNLWDTKSVQKLESQAQCLHQQFKSKRNELKNRSDNMVDVNGLNLAYQAYNQWLSEHPDVLDLLPQFYKVNQHQLFFIAASQMWCVTDDILRVPDFHDVTKIKVMRMMENSPEFAKAFKCKRGTEMNPAKKCELY